MAASRLAAWLDSYRLDVKDALARAAGDGFRFVHASTTHPQLDPRGLSQSGRRHLARLSQQLGIQLESLGPIFPGLGLADSAHADERLDALRQALELCRSIGAPLATTNLSGLSDPATGGLVADVLRHAAELADRSGVSLAIHPGQDDPAELARHLATLGCPALRVAVDTAHDLPGGGAATEIGRWLGVVHCRDVRRSREGVEETEFGQGQVRFDELLDMLSRCEYNGRLLVRRDAANAGAQALERGRTYLETLLAGCVLRRT